MRPLKYFKESKKTSNKEKSHPVIRVAGVSILAAARVVARVVAAQRVHTARVRQQALVDI